MFRLLHAVVAAAVATALAGDVAAQGLALRPLRGVVVADDQTSAPLRRVRVEVSAAGLSADAVFTDEQGRFAVAVPASAPYTLSVSKPGFARRTLASPAGSATATGLQIRLATGAVISGRVLDHFGDPVRTRVRIRGARRDLTADTDDRGEYRAGSLAAGRYEVAVVSPGPPSAAVGGRSGQEPPARTVDVGAGEEITLVHVDRAVATSVAVQAGMPVSRTAPPPRPSRIATAVIGGRVVTLTGRPVGGAAVMVIWVGSGQLPRSAGEQVRVTMTDANGRYEVRGLLPGEYRINAAKLSASLFPLDRSVTARVNGGQVIDDVDVRMGPSSAVTGTVVDDHGEPVEGATVELWERRRGAGRTMLLPAIGVPPRRTDDRGRYRLFGAGPGADYRTELRAYYVVASDEPRRSQPGGPAGAGSTRVYYPGTAAIRDAVPIQVAAGRDAESIDITFAPRVTGRVHGFAVDASARPLTEPVSLRDSARSGFPTPAERTAAVGADGAFTFLNVPPGDYVVQGIVPGPGRAAEFAAQYVTVTDGDAAPVVLRTSPGSTLTGRIVAEGNTSGLSLDEFGLSVQVADWDYAEVGNEQPHASVEPDGTFEMAGLRGRLWITGSAPEGWWLKSVSVGASDAAYQPFDFGGATSRIDNVVAVFADDAGEITGRVLDGGEPVSEYSVLLFSTDRNRWWAPSGHVMPARGRGDGVFRVASMPPGDYLAAAVDTFDLDAEWLDPDILATLAPSARRISLRPRQQLRIDLDLIRRQP